MAEDKGHEQDTGCPELYVVKFDASQNVPQGKDEEQNLYGTQKTPTPPVKSHHLR
jgi:hypothetical protein